MSAATATVAATSTGVPLGRPRRENTVAVARTAMIDRNVSHPIEVSHETIPGTFWPCTPNAARESTIVGALPRLPAIAIRPHRKNEIGMPMRVTRVACQKLTPKPRM